MTYLTRAHRFFHAAFRVGPEEPGDVVSESYTI
jgi:hypothetical protein